MRALTCYPHWAHAICWLGKPIENRGRPIPRALVGERIAIHAGATLDERIAPWVRGGGRVERWAAELIDAAPLDDPAYPGFSAGYRLVRDSDDLTHWTRTVPQTVEPDGITEHVVVTRAIVATAIVRPHEPSRAEWLYQNAQPPAWADPTAREWWALTDVQRLVVPVPIRRGQLGLWRLPDDEAAAVDAAAKEAA